MTLAPLFAQMGGFVVAVGMVLFSMLAIGLLYTFVKLYQKVEQGTALVRNGLGGTKVSFGGMMVLPVVHRAERMDISVKRIEIYRHGEDGLICQDNIRADIKVAFFVRVNKTAQDVEQVAQLLGCARASEEQGLVELFDAKFSEALKTVGKQFEFVELYNSRDRFKDEILKIIGTDLNGYVLDDAAIDYLEQTPVEKLNPNNILDADGIKKITDLTAKQQVLAN
ncbi:MAG: flotillin family protein, partial [Planctomycetales bacterium]|nr:flotillin family protein [Planctomycetales bacterium]